MAQNVLGFVQREMPLQDDVEVIGEVPLRLLSVEASGQFLERNPTEVSTDRPTCSHCGSSSCCCMGKQ
jgi:hypothetical protein